MHRPLLLLITFLAVSCHPWQKEISKSEKLNSTLESNEISLSEMPAAIEKFRRSAEDTLLPRIDFKVTELDYSLRFLIASDFLVGDAGKVSDDLKKLSSLGSDLLLIDTPSMVGQLSKVMSNFTTEKICETGQIIQYEESVDKHNFFYVNLKNIESEKCSEQLSELEPVFRKLKNYESYTFKKGIFPLALGGYITSLVENEQIQMRTRILSDSDLAKPWRVVMARDLKSFVSLYLEFHDKMHDYIIRDEIAETVAFDPAQRENIQTLARNTLLRMDFQVPTSDGHFESVKKVFRNAIESLEAYASESNKLKIDYYRN